MRYVVCDVFTDRALEGNQLAVFVEAPPIPEHLLQALAREMNFSETVFVYQPDDENADARIRIFTPKTELPFAGHPILGTAFVLAARNQLDEVRLKTSRGVVPVRMTRDNGKPRFGWMSQPIPTVAPFQREAELLRALGVPRSSLPIELYDNGAQFSYVALDTQDQVASLQPDLAALARLLPHEGVSCFAGDGRRWKTRMFAPGEGAAEDPATGSAAGPLAVHLVRHGRLDFGEEIQISQGAELRRPSTLHARVQGSDGQIQRVEVGGSAVIVAEGRFTI